MTSPIASIPGLLPCLVRYAGRSCEDYEQRGVKPLSTVPKVSICEES